MESSRKILKIFSVIYMLGAVIAIIFAICLIAKPSLIDAKMLEKYSNIKVKESDLKTAVIVGVFVQALVYLIYSTMIRNVAKGKSSGGILMVLLAFSAVGGITSIISKFTVGALFYLAIDVILLLLVINARKR